MAQRQKTNLTIYQGDDRDYKFTITKSAVAWDISAATAVRFAAKQDISDSAALFTVTPTVGGSGQDWAHGIVIISIPAASSALLTRDGAYDLQITLSSKKTTVVYGDLLLQKQVVD